MRRVLRRLGGRRNSLLCDSVPGGSQISASPEGADMCSSGKNIGSATSRHGNSARWLKPIDTRHPQSASSLVQLRLQPKRDPLRIGAIVSLGICRPLQRRLERRNSLQGIAEAASSTSSSAAARYGMRTPLLTELRSIQSAKKQPLQLRLPAGQTTTQQ